MTEKILVEELEELKKELKEIEQQIQENKKQIKCTEIHHIGFRDILKNEINELEKIWHAKWKQLAGKQENRKSSSLI